MDKTTYAQLEETMRACMKDAAHDGEHVRRVLYLALELAGHEQNVDYDVLIAACLLHDIGRAEQYKNPAVCHAQAGAEKAYTYLLENKWPESKASHVRECIRTHRFRSERPPQSIEAKILFDADKLDVTGTIGIARTLAYNALVGESLYTVDAQGRVSPGEDDVAPSFFQEYKYKLEKLYDKFYTRRAREIAEERRHSAAVFYESMLREVQDCYADGMRELEGILGEKGIKHENDR